MAGHFRASLAAATAPPSKSFPDRPQFSGFMKPCRFEGEVRNLEIAGTVPTELDGTFYRVMPDPQFPPFIDNDPWFNGDGNVSAFSFHNGNVDFQQKYVRTEKFVREREANRALAGKYRNKYTDAVEFKVRTTANTNIYYFNKSLLAIKEDAAPYLMDPVTLETKGPCDFDGQLPSLTFTAHPKLDPVTGELVCFGYEAKGDGTPDVCYFSIDADGKFNQTVWLIAPVVGMIHDFAVTDNWVLFPIIPQICDIERLKAGGEHWQWDSNVPIYIGVLPRRGAKGSDVKWFRAPNAFPGHTTNAYETPAGKIVFDLPLTDKNVFFWWPDAEGNAPDPHDIHAEYVRFEFDPTATEHSLDLPKPTVILKHDMEFPRIDDRFATKAHRHSWFDMMDPSLGTDFAAIMPVLGGGHPLYNALGHLDHETGKLEVYYPGSTHMVQEPVFVPRGEDAAEGDGFLVVLVNNYKTMSSELHVIDTRKFSEAAAVVKVPMRLRAGLHGNWVDAKELR
ncbi:Lignostilbene-alpha,beta-dioxygenase isozyme III [Colletotrichum sp. SAR 10_70]|nr:Lignostilbene-alpha,beta-dioxygenase isozyme III [Colletotrichum sp. SAR 10_71]KAI8197557.1 Lignostilbene-alpha,beta-dioxygenase isozyme III [Colletotrichum sp. SAR 10_70]KAI8199673.1 Lignostilbene-alpha,beta-dioxygenase isozyme III [Colletotrichum sp. SAR 10_76]KAJ4996751.1 Lignostilbene-alpha,beta-dioxygenase isozyme III [Colletotrichum sp. SAR 10_66]